MDKLTHYLNIPCKELFAPINNKIFFTGEHTTMGTMEAAVEFGERAAKAVLSSIKL